MTIFNAEMFILETRIQIEYVQMQIRSCKNDKHFQQVAYSIHEECLTVICFDCKQITTNR